MAVLSFSLIYLSAGCRPVTTIPARRPLKRSDISTASLFLTASKCIILWSGNAGGWTKKTAPPAPTPTRFYQPRTPTDVRRSDEPPDRIFTVDNLFPSGCCTQTVSRR